jgi:3-oxoacyl-[acyl-carrier protein] reductase
MQDKTLLNKRVFITGATSGIGKACALYYLNAGAKVILCGRDLETLKSIGKKFPEQAAVIKLDLVKELPFFDLKGNVSKILDGLDIVINCAGAIFDGDVEKTFLRDYEYLVDLNLKANFLIMGGLKDLLKKGSSIVNVSCLYGSKPQSGMIAQCMSKKGLELLTKYAAAEYAPKGIRVNCVTACPVDTNCQRYVGVSETEYSQFKERVGQNIPLGRMATPDEVAKAIIFLSSNKASRITGNTLKVDGGRSLTQSGYFPWRGSKEMNARFEPDGFNNSVVMNKLWGKVTGKKEEKVVFPLKDDEIDKVIDKVFQESNWATRLSEAHEKIGANYKNIEQNNDYLKENFADNNKN